MVLDPTYNRVFGLEIKSKNDRLSTYQVLMHQHLKSIGLPVYVVRDLHELTKLAPEFFPIKGCCTLREKEYEFFSKFSDFMKCFSLFYKNVPPILSRENWDEALSKIYSYIFKEYIKEQNYE